MTVPRKAAIKGKIPYMTTIAAARATAKGIHYVQQHSDSDVKISSGDSQHDLR